MFTRVNASLYPTKVVLRPGDTLVLPKGRVRIMQAETGEPFPEDHVFYKEQRKVYQLCGYNPNGNKTKTKMKKQREEFFHLRILYDINFVGNTE